MIVKKKMTRKQIQEKYENLKIDTQRRLADLRKENEELKLGAAQLSNTVDILIGWIAEMYGVKMGEGEYQLYVPKSNTRYRIEARVRDKDGEVIGYTYTATEAEDEQVREQKDSD